jgi:chaperonin GroES
VIAAGDGKINENGTRRPLDVKPGDRVLFGKYSGSEVTIDDQDYLIMREDEILGVFVSASKSRSAGR